MNLELITEDDCLVLIDRAVKITKGDYFINLNFDETYGEIERFHMEHDFSDFKDYADENWTKNCFKVLGYRYFDDRDDLPDLPKLPIPRSEDILEAKAMEVYREVVKYGMVEDLPSNSQWVRGVFRKGFEFAQSYKNGLPK